MNCKIAVIIPTYNHEKYIGRCLRSLLNQTISQKNFQIIVIDDASTDRTNFALKLFKDPNESVINIITNVENIGLPASINKGIQSCHSKYVVRVDSDDYVNTNFLNLLYIYLEENPEVHAVSCDYIVVDNNENVIERCNSFSKPIACGIMFRREYLIEIGLYDELFRCNEEKDLRIRFEEKYKIERLSIPLYRYRRHSNNITNDKQMIDDFDKKLEKKHSISLKKQNNAFQN